MARHRHWRGIRASIVGVALLALAASPPTANADIILDTFVNGPHSSSFIGTGTGAGTPSTVTGAFDNDPVGNSRRVTASKTNATVSSMEFAGTTVGGGILTVGGSANAAGHSGIQYGTTSDLNLDISGSSFLHMDFVAPVSNLRLNFTVTTTGFGSSTFSNYLLPTSTSVDIPLSTLTGSAMLSDIDSIYFDFFALGTAYSAQITATSISVPEPSGLALTIVGMIGITLRGRFRRPIMARA